MEKSESPTSTFKCWESTAAVLIFCVFNKKKVFVAERTSGLHKGEVLKFHELFPILVFEGSLSIGGGGG